MALAETHHRKDVPRQRFNFDGFKAWHADRGGKDKVLKIKIKFHYILTIIETNKLSFKHYPCTVNPAYKPPKYESNF